ncbi:MAG: hypothetical protein P8X90_03125 [Desulfobacterales bacterium]
MKSFFLLLAGIISLALIPISGVQAKEIVKFGTDVIVDENMTVKEVVVFGADIAVNGTVQKDVVAIGGNIFLGPTAKVGKEVVAIGGVIDKEPGALIGDDEIELNIPGLSSLIGFSAAANWVGWALAFKILAFIGFLALALLIVAVIPKPFVLISTAVQQYTLKTILLGISGLVVLIPLALFLAITIIGLPIVALEVFVVGIVFLVGYIAVAQLMGDKIAALMKRPALNALWVTLLGLLTLWLIGWIPFIGSLVKAAAIFLGFGGVLAVLFTSGTKFHLDLKGA